MNQRIVKLRSFIEWQAFGVCSAIGARIGVATSRIRLWFIYISFLTLGSPFIIYMILAFWMNMKRYIFQQRRNPGTLGLILLLTTTSLNGNPLGCRFCFPDAMHCAPTVTDEK